MVECQISILVVRGSSPLYCSNFTLTHKLKRKGNMRISFEQLDLEVEKLYQRQIDENDLTTINEHCEFIHNFILACGWDMQEYLDEGWDRMWRKRMAN